MTTLDVATYSQIMTLLTQLSTNYTNVFTDYYNIFLNPEPMDVTLQLFDEDGNLDTITIPNRAKDRAYILNGEGDPNGRVSADRGSTYQDLANGAVYVKINADINGWAKFVTGEELDTFIKQGSGSPEGTVIATKGILYIDTQNAGLYIKATSAGSTGWLLVSANTATLADVNLDNLSTEGYAKFANPSLSNLNNTGNAVLAAKEDRSNKVISVTASSDNTQYPSARAVYNYVNGITDNLANRDMTNLTEEGQLKVVNQKQMRDCVLSAPSGAATYSGRVITLPAATVLLCTNGLDENYKHENQQVTTSSALSVSLPATWTSELEGVLFYNADNDQLYVCTEANYFRETEAPAVPSTYAVWYDTNNNKYYYRSGSSWAEMSAAEIGRFTLANGGTINEWNPFYPVTLATQDELETFTKKMVTQASTTFEYTPDGQFVKNDVVFVDSLDTTFDPSSTDHPDAVWLYSSPVYPYVPMNLTNSGTSYSFVNGGMVVCTSATDVIIGAGELSPVTFTGFVGILPVAAGTNVTTNVAAYFVGY